MERPQRGEQGELYVAVVAQLVEHVIGNDEVRSSILRNGSKDLHFHKNYGILIVIACNVANEVSFTLSG